MSKTKNAATLLTGMVLGASLVGGAAAGMSCGGLQTLDNSADPRFKT